MENSFELLSRGGPVMVLIGVLSVVAVTLLLERLYTLQRRRIVPARLVQLVRDHVERGEIDEARQLCSTSDAPIAAILHAGLRRADAGRVVVREVMQDRGRREMAEMERFTGALGGIATISPLLGLLGTILGMIRTFQQVNNTVAASGQVAPGALANGIWEALITTAAGLAVAIPTFVFYRWIIARIDRLGLDMEEISLELAERMTAPARTSAAGSPTGSATTVASASPAHPVVESDEVEP
jgi:biopolymer transport protein ExbB